MISCQEAVQRLWEFLDDTVHENDRALIDEHLARCRRCCGELDFAIELRRLLNLAPATDIPADVLRRLNRTLEEMDNES